MKNINHCNKTLAFLLAAVLIAATLIVPGKFVSAQTKGNVMFNKSSCTVRLSDKIMNKRGRQYATVTLDVRNSPFNWKTKHKVTVTMKDERGRLIWKGITSGKQKLKLGNDHRTYVITVTPNSSNANQGDKWEFNSPKNCTIR